jgi:hypothetical protein
MYGSAPLTLSRVGAGLAAGFVLSVLSLAAGSALTAETLLAIWAGMLILALFKLRFICVAYAAGALGILQAVLTWTGVQSLGSGGWSEAVRVLLAIDVPALLFLAGLLHVAEGMLVRLQGAKSAIPLFLESKRGKPIGAYALSGVWPVPLLWMVPAAGGGGFTLPWMPLFEDAAAWSFAAFPVLIAFSDRTETYYPEQKAASAGRNLVIYGLLIAALAAGAAFWAPLAVIASALAVVLHEGLIWYSRMREHGRAPLYVQDGSGVRILAVLPGTPAAELGLVSGETIRKVNGMPTRTKEELHDALERQSAFTKLEVVNREGEVKFLQRARYEGEHHQLGLVLAPDEAAVYVAAPRFYSFWQLMQNAGARRRQNAVWAVAEPEAGQREQAAAGEDANTDAAAVADKGSEAGEGAVSGPGIDAGASPGKAADAGVTSAASQADSDLPPRRLRRSR